MRRGKSDEIDVPPGRVRRLIQRFPGFMMARRAFLRRCAKFTAVRQGFCGKVFITVHSITQGGFMNNTIELNSITRMAALLAQSTAAGGRTATADNDFLRTAAQIYAAQMDTGERVPARSVPGFSEVGQFCAGQTAPLRSGAAQPGLTQSIQAQGDTGLEAYKQSIWEKISRLPMSASQKIGSISIQISDAGFQAMKNDPEYEAWVLDTLGQNFLFQNPWVSICGGTYSIHSFGATKEEYRGSSWNAGYMGGQGVALFDTKAGKSFWEQRAERQEEFMEQQAKAAARRKMLMRLRMNGTPVSIAELLLGML